MYAEVRRLLAEEEAYFGSPQLHIPRSVRKKLGGGVLLDISVYCLQFVLNGKRPASIQATRALLDSGMTRHMWRMQICIFRHELEIVNWLVKQLL